MERTGLFQCGTADSLVAVFLLDLLACSGEEEEACCFLPNAMAPGG